jgi:carbon monoxide dehydrogenase subunit G
MARNHSNKAIIKAKVGKDGMFGITTIELIRREPHAPAMVCYTGKGKIIGGVYHLSADFRLKERPSGGTHIYWKGAVAFKGRIFSTFGEAGLNGYVENEVYEAISNIRALLDDAWINPQGQI